MSQSFLHKLSAMDALDDSRLLRTLIDALPEQVYVKNAEGRYILNNLAHVRALGAASPEEIAGKSDFDFYPEELAERYRADEREVTRSGRPLIDKEEPSVDGEGNERRHSTTKVPLRDGDGEILGLLGMTWDETERKLAEEALKESEERFRTAFEDAPIGVALVDLDGRRFRVNQALCEMLGYSEEELLSKDHKEHIHPDDREISSNHLRRTLEKGAGTYTLERRYIHVDGHVIWNLTERLAYTGFAGQP
jgi:PAS domain S-box-containing protein